MIRIDSMDLPYLELADVGQAEIGAKVLALAYTTPPNEIGMISGVVSDLKVDAGRNIRWLEIDVRLGREYDGGPALNLYGEVAGVVDTKTISGAPNSAGLVIASNTVNVYLERLTAGEIIVN